MQIPPMLSTLLGTALAFFVGFNNNQAYSRWWEARTIWGGLVNDSRSWARNLIYYTGGATGTVQMLADEKNKMILRHIAFVYALKENLRKKTDGYFEQYLTVEEVKFVRQQNNISNAILSLNAANLQKLSLSGELDSFRFIQLSELIKASTDNMGKSERIKNTVYPTSYVYFTKLFIWVLVVLVTLNLADTMGAWSVLFGWIVGFVFHATHINGMSLIDPFDEIPMGIPLNQIARTIEINLLQMMGSSDIPDPEPIINGEYVL
jgi:putative membrane protein